MREGQAADIKPLLPVVVFEYGNRILGQGRRLHGGVRIAVNEANLSDIYMVIPQHLMDEISMNTGLTNVSTVNVSVQLTFDISRIDDNLNNDLGQIRTHGIRNAPGFITDA